MCVTTYTATLELKTEKANAHSGAILSVAYSPDGSQILTGSKDKSLKVWEYRPFLESEWEEVDISAMPKNRDGYVKIPGSREYTNSNYWKNKVTGNGEKTKPSAGEP